MVNAEANILKRRDDWESSEVAKTGYWRTD